MKVSKYTLYHILDGHYYIYHQITKAIIEVDRILYDTLYTNEINSIPEETLNYLIDAGVVTPNDLNESDPIIVANYKSRYGSDVLRVTILPTLNCNFNCWYCYETHKPSKMNSIAIEASLKFIKRILIQGSKKELILDWFGGEPLIYFNSIVYPFTLDLKKWCLDNKIKLSCIMTSNGSLITPEIAMKFVEMGLYQIQITLDGGKSNHNKIRYSNSIPDSYSTIINNIHTLCRTVAGICIDLRINYTRNNIGSLCEVLKEFAPDVRHSIQISPHIVWQESEEIENLSLEISKFKTIATKLGYVVCSGASTKCTTCYTENIDQYVINYNLNVYKCTARDFSHANSIGYIQTDGTFKPNGLYYKFISEQSPFINNRCLDCEILPSCLYATSCIQKKIEGYSPECPKHLILQDIHQSIHSQIQSQSASKYHEKN